MKDFSHLLTIGQLSKLSDIHVKALRYYESIGILTPSFVDPGNGYRYYSHTHITYVQIIKICASYGLPLKEFTKYLIDDQQIDMMAILKAAGQELDRQAEQLKKDRDYLRNLDQQVQLSEHLDHSQERHLDHQEEYFLLVDFDGDMLSKAYYQAVREQLANFEEQGIRYADRLGCYYVYEAEELHQYLAFRVSPIADFQAHQILGLQYQHLHAQHISQEAIHAQLDHYHKEQGLTRFLILETFESPLKLADPHLELRYFLD